MVEDGSTTSDGGGGRNAWRALRRARGAKSINVARNQAVPQSTGDLICLLDDDVEVWPGWLRGAARARPGTRPSAARSGHGWRAPTSERADGSHCRSPRSTSGTNGPRGRLRLGRELRVHAGGVRAGRAVRRAACGCGRRGGLAAATEGGRRAGRVCREGRRRSPAGGQRCEAASAVSRRVSPRAGGAALRGVPRRASAARRRAADARRLPVAHRAPPLRRRDRAHRADARAARGSARSRPRAAERGRSRLPVGRRARSGGAAR